MCAEKAGYKRAMLDFLIELVEFVYFKRVPLFNKSAAFFLDVSHYLNLNRIAIYLKY
jgi:hypothetical protein